MSTATVASIFENQKLPVSFEIFPPKGDLTLTAARAMASELAELKPSFVSVTCSAGGSGNGQATPAIAAMIADEFDVPTVAHLTCINASSQSISDAIADMRERGIANVLALRGDVIPGNEPSASFQYAKDLIPVLADAGFCVGAAAYPEGHIACESDAASIEHLKMKQDAGAQFLVTQLCFDNERIYRFMDAADRAGITPPITHGIMPFMSKDQISRMVFMCGASLPSAIIKLLAKYENDAEALRQAGIEYACGQLIDLAQHGVDGLHVYCMNKPEVARAGIEAVRNAGF
ncbi:MAG: methylenetetrahydrofolate reductase [Eggerthellaceae bacterium]|nr:methylenetetrahydrofolate reductase [Eggerthellaceae bacterium]